MIEAEKGLEDAIERAAEEFAYQAIASREETILIGNAMRRALQVVLKYQQEHLPGKKSR